jgi:hypothetical protein
VAPAAGASTPGYVTYPVRRRSSGHTYQTIDTRAILAAAAVLPPVRGLQTTGGVIQSGTVAAAIPGQQTGQFHVVRHALSDAFNILHPRGGDGRFIDKGGSVKWKTDTGLWMRGTVDKLDASGNIDVTGSDGVKRTIPAKKLFSAPAPVAKLSPSSFQFVQGQGGSNQGGFYKDPKTGDVWYVKKPQTADHVANEVAANKLYAAAGAAVPEIRTSPDGKQLLSKIENSEGWYQLSDSEKRLARESIRKNFIVDAWLGNYDAPRNDNIRITEDGVPIRVDTGGALKYRARGGTKPKLPVDMTAEITRLRQQSAYAGMTKTDEEDAVKRILALSPDEIEQIVKDAGMDKSTADMLVARRAWLGASYGYQLPETTPAGKAALAARAAQYGGGNAQHAHLANPGGSGGSNSGGSVPSPAVRQGTPTPAAPAVPAPSPAPVANTSLVPAIRKRDPGTAVPIAPGSPVWLKRKPKSTGAKYPDTWIVDSVSADGNTIGIKTAAGQKLAVQRDALEPLRSNLSSVKSVYATGEQSSIGDRVALDLPAGTDPNKHPGDGTIKELFPMYARVEMDNGKSKVVNVKKLSLVPDKGTIAPTSNVPAAPVVTPAAPAKSGLYTTPFDGNTIQNDYIKQAEAMIRAGQFTNKTFATDKLMPTQDQAHTNSGVSGRGAKDLGPIVARINGVDYLLDGHHRAADKSRIKTQFVDFDAAKTAPAVSKPATNPKGIEFDLKNHDFSKTPHPVGYSLTHNVKVTFFSKAIEKDGTESDRDIIALLHNKANPKDILPVRIRADNFRQLDSVDHDALVVEAKALADKRATAKAARAGKAAVKPGPPQINTLDDAKKILKPVPIKVKYESGNLGEYGELRPGDQVVDIRDGAAMNPGIWMLRDGEAHYLGSNRQGEVRYNGAKPENNELLRFLSSAISAYGNINNLTQKLGKSPDWVKAANLANTHGPNDDKPYDIQSALSKKWPIDDGVGSNGYSPKIKKIDRPAWLSHNVRSYVMPTDPKKDASGNIINHLKPVFVFDGDKDKIYYVGDFDQHADWANREKNINPPDKWVELTQSERDFYFEPTNPQYTFGAGSKSTVVTARNLTMRDAHNLQNKQNAIPRPSQALKNSAGEDINLPPRVSYYHDQTLDTMESVNMDDRQLLTYERGNGSSGMAANMNVLDGKLTPQAMLPKSTGKMAIDVIAQATDPNVQEPKSGDVLPGHRAPFVETRYNPVQALGYKLPTSKTMLDDGKQDNDLLASRLVIPEAAERVKRPGSRSRPSFKMASDGTTQKDPLMYEFTKLVGGDAGVVRLPKADFDAYVAKNNLTVYYRGVGSAESATDFRSGTYFAGEGVYGSGSYASNRLSTAQNSYAGGNGSNVTRIVNRPDAKTRKYGDLYADMIKSVKSGSDSRLKLMQSLGLAPSDAELYTKPTNTNPTWQRALANHSSLANPSDAQIRQMVGDAESMINFYEKKGLQLDEVEIDHGYYSGGREIKLLFKTPGSSNRFDPDEMRYRVTLTKAETSSKARSRIYGAGSIESGIVYDFAGASQRRFNETRDESISYTSTSGEAFVSGFSSPKKVLDFARAIDSKIPELPAFSKDALKATVKDRKESEQLVEKVMNTHPELTELLGISARLEFIQDVGRYALATGIDRFDIPQGNYEDFVVFTHRNTLVMSR